MRSAGRVATVISALTVVLSSPGLATAAAGNPDLSFSRNGRIRIDVVGTDDQAGTDVAIDPRNGDIVVLARIFPDIAVIRLTPDGGMDPTFGGGDGVAVFSRSPDGVFGYSIDVGPDGHVLVGGSVWGSTGGAFEMRGMLLRFDERGELDRSFSEDGLLLSDDHDSYFDVLQTDTKILTIGTTCGFSCGGAGFVARFLSDGTPDPSFSNDGAVVLDWVNPTSLNQLDVDASGRITAAGMTEAPSRRERSLMVRIRDDGTLDPTFCGDGMIVKDLGSGDYQLPLDVRAFDDGSSIAIWNPPNLDAPIAIVHRRPSCALDPAFGSGGIAIASLPGGDATVTAGWIRRGGSVVVAGYTFGFRPFVARLTAAGEVDTGFGDSGLAMLPVDNSGFYGVIADGRGRAVATGWADRSDGVQKVLVARFKAS